LRTLPLQLFYFNFNLNFNFNQVDAWLESARERSVLMLGAAGGSHAEVLRQGVVHGFQVTTLGNLGRLSVT
jgi:hypothetical protein